MKFTNMIQNTKGFTLVEALVAISILMIAIASPLSIAQKGLSSAVLSRNEMTASFLAQDGIEAVKNIRDQIALKETSGDWINRSDGSYGVSKCICMDTDANCSNFTAGTNWCNIDTSQYDLAQSASIYASSTNPNPLKINYTSGVFTSFGLGGGGTNSLFSRKINIHVSTTNPNEAAVNVQVTFSSPFGAQTTTIKDFIYNYSQNL